MNDHRRSGAPQPTVGSRAEATDTDAMAVERRRLSRMLHDGLAQDLASLGYLLDHAAAADDPATNAEAVATAHDRMSSIRAELRRVIDDLRRIDAKGSTESGHTDAEILGRTLARFARDAGNRHGLAVQIDCSDATGILAGDIAEELDRIGREAITNAARHSRGRSLWLTVRVDGRAATLIVADDGAGIAATREQNHDPTLGHGVAIIAERAERIGGSVHISDRPGGGTVVTVSTGEESHDDGARLRDPGRRP